MKKMFIIAWKDFKIRYKDRKGFLLMILMPVVLTAILGMALSGVLGGDISNLPKTTIGVYVEDEDALADTFINDVLKSEDLKEFIAIKNFKDEKKLEPELEEGDIDVAFRIPSGWSKNIQSGELKQVKVYADPSKEVQSGLATSILDSFVSRVKAVSVTTQTVFANLDYKNGQNPEIQRIAGEISGSAKEQGVAIESKTVGEKPISSMQYYAAAMGVMFLLFNIMVGAKSILNERETETLARLMTTPTSRVAILFGKFLGTLYFAIAQFVVFWAATSIIFKVNWGENILQVFAVGIVFSVSVSGLSMLLASVVSEEKTADLVGNIGVQVLAILGGSMMPITIFPEGLMKIANFVPNKWALFGFLDTMQGVAWSGLLQGILILLIIGIGSVIIGTFRLRAR